MSDTPTTNSEITPTSFRPCPTCHGQGFRAAGSDVMTQRFHKCTVCEGSGQIYLAPKPQQS